MESTLGRKEKKHPRELREKLEVFKGLEVTMRLKSKHSQGSGGVSQRV